MKKRLYKVSEIFTSIDGEGIRTGYPVTFIRLYGCNLNCSYCDSRYSCDGEEYSLMTSSDIIDKVYQLGFNKLTLTGGEPLYHKYCYNLVNDLTSRGYEVNIETNGSCSIREYISEPIIITMDYKCPSSRMESEMFIENLKYLRTSDVLKFVVGSLEDLNKMEDILNEHEPQSNIFVSPVFGKIDPKTIIEFLIEHKLYDVRIQLQLHKLIWNPDERGV